MVDEQNRQIITEIEQYARKNKVPIMEQESLNFILNLIKENNVRSILEIGTAIAYSAIKMALINENITITTIEKDEERYREALKNIKEINLQARIEVIKNDALEITLDKKYDLILIDASKAQNKKFFEKFEQNLNQNGLIITDNLSFHGYVEKNIDEIESKNIRGLVKKIKLYIEFLKENKDYNTKFYSLGDGISVSKRIG